MTRRTPRRCRTGGRTEVDRLVAASEAATAGLDGGGRTRTAQPAGCSRRRSTSATTSRCCPRLPGRVVPARLHRPAVQHRQAQRRRTLRPSRDGERRPHRLRRPPLPHRGRRPDVATPTLRRLPRRSSRRGSSEAHRLLDRRRHALLPHRLPRGALLQGAARRDLRPRLLPQRDRSGPTTTARRTKRRWPAKHDTILVYVKDAGALPLRRRGRSTASRTWRPGWSAPEKAARGKLPTDVWWHTIVPTDRAARRPATRRRSRRACCAGSSQPSSRPGDWCLDFFAGSGTTRRGGRRARAAVRAGRREPGGGRR